VQESVLKVTLAMTEIVQLIGSWIGHNGLLAQQLVETVLCPDREFVTFSVSVMDQIEKKILAMTEIVLQLQLNGAHGVNLVLVMSLVAMVLINEHENA